MVTAFSLKWISHSKCCVIYGHSSTEFRKNIKERTKFCLRCWNNLSFRTIRSALHGAWLTTEAVSGLLYRFYVSFMILQPTDYGAKRKRSIPGNAFFLWFTKGSIKFIWKYCSAIVVFDPRLLVFGVNDDSRISTRIQTPVSWWFWFTWVDPVMTGVLRYEALLTRYVFFRY